MSHRADRQAVTVLSGKKDVTSTKDFFWLVCALSPVNRKGLYQG